MVAKHRKPGPRQLTNALQSGEGVALRSEGQRLLLKVDAGPTLIARTVEVTPQAVIEWRFGRKVPRMPARVALREAYGIPVMAWSRLPGGRAPVEPDNDVACDALPPPTDTPAPSTLEHCAELLAQIRAQRSARDLMPADRVRLADTEAKILGLRHRLEKEAELLEDRICREHPAWKRARGELARVLARHPQAALEVAEALARLGL
jgi:hypothetical protein